MLIVLHLDFLGGEITSSPSLWLSKAFTIMSATAVCANLKFLVPE